MNNNNYSLQKRKCYFCSENIQRISYKDINLLKRFVSSYGKITPKRRNGSCSKHQRMLASAIKRARYLAFMPYVAD
ncbi:30S ribosomal protein S18 [Patescibacteria group bacterium]|nr:30S ribosomal protein S18 [Patescibacteria group bacterium]